MKTLTEKLFLFLLPLLFTFPLFKENVSSAILILVVLNTLLYCILQKGNIKFSWEIATLTIPFWILVVYSLLTNTLVENSTHIQHALFFLIIPVCFSVIPISFFSEQKLRLYFNVLKNTCVLIGIVYLCAFFLHHSFDELFVVFQNHNVSAFRDFVYSELKIIQIHPTYLSSIIVLCCIYSFDRYLKEKKYTEIFYVAFFLLFCFLLLAKLNIVFLVVALIGMQLFRSNLPFQRKALITSGLIGAILMLSLFTPGIKNRFSEVLTSLNKPPQGIDYNSTNIRKAVFDCSVDLIQSDFLKGVGFSNLQQKLTSCYEGKYLSHFYYEHQYMTHNYFFYILISSGILGFLCFLYYVFYVIKIALKIRSFVFSVFLINILFMSLIEDFMYRHYGGLFFNLFLMVFLQHAKFLRNSTPEDRFTAS